MLRSYRPGISFSDQPPLLACILLCANMAVAGRWMEVLAYPPARIVATYSTYEKKEGRGGGAPLQNKLDTDRYNSVTNMYSGNMTVAQRTKEANSLIASNPNILTTSSRSYFRMFSLCKPLSDCGVDNPGPGTAVCARNLCALQTIPIIIGPAWCSAGPRT